MAKPRYLVIDDLTGGQNGSDPPLSLPANQCVSAVNVDWAEGRLARKRGGHSALSMTGGTAYHSTDAAYWIFRHVPGADETAAEMWSWGRTNAGHTTGQFKRLAAGTSWADISADDNSTPPPIHGVSFNGKLFVTYDSSVDRLHCYDPSLSSPRIRRVGIDPGSTAPTAANTGAGATWPITARYYRVRFYQMNGSIVVRESEPTPSVFFTSSGAGDATRVTRPAAPGEGETHWQLEISTDNVTFYPRGVKIVIATTTDDDNFALAAFQAIGLSEAAGTYGLFPSVKYLLTDGNRLLGAGAWESSGTTSGGRSSRVWYSAILGSSDLGDDERVPNTTTQKNWIDLNEKDGGAITGLGGPLNGIIYVFKFRAIWALIPTGDFRAPYLTKKIRDDIGCISQWSIVLGDDGVGNSALYFLSHRGPYRITVRDGIQYLGRDDERNIWNLLDLTFATYFFHSVYYPDLHQVWWQIIDTAVGSRRMCFDTRLGRPAGGDEVRGGWSAHSLTIGGASMCLFATSVGASMGLTLAPYISSSGAPAIYRANTGTDDAGSNFQAYITTRPLLPSGELGRNGGIGEGQLLAKAASGVTITQTVIRDFGLETRTATCSLTAAASETRVLRKFEAGDLADAGVIQITLGDGSAASNGWTLDTLMVPILDQEIR